MPELMPFGKYAEKSVEQIALQDYKYFRWLLDKADIRKPSLRNRFQFVYNVANDFISAKSCTLCENPAKYLSIYYGFDSVRTSSLPFVYCSSNCYDNDPAVSDSKSSLEPLKFDTALSIVKFDTNRLVEIIAECMGMKKGRRTKEYLEDFFNCCSTYK